MENLLQKLLQRYRGTSVIAPLAIGVQATNKKFHLNHYDCHCGSDDCVGNDCYNCHCCSDDCSDCYDCHCSSDDCVGDCMGPSH